MSERSRLVSSEVDEKLTTDNEILADFVVVVVVVVVFAVVVVVSIGFVGFTNENKPIGFKVVFPFADAEYIGLTGDTMVVVLVLVVGVATDDVSGVIVANDVVFAVSISREVEKFRITEEEVE